MNPSRIRISVFLLNIIRTTVYGRRQLFVGRLATSGPFRFSPRSAANRTSAVPRVQPARGWTFAPLNRQTMHRKGGFICPRVLVSPTIRHIVYAFIKLEGVPPSLQTPPFVTLTRVLFVLGEKIGRAHLPSQEGETSGRTSNAFFA